MQSTEISAHGQTDVKLSWVMQPTQIGARGQTDVKITWKMDWTGKFPLGLASTVIIDSESHGTHSHILLSHNSGGTLGNAATEISAHGQTDVKISDVFL
jgi:hypothetical protein